MTRALAYKELRETAGILAVGLLALLTVATASMGVEPMSSLLSARYQQGLIPFLSDSFMFQFGCVALALAVALGFWQSFVDFLGGAQAFLLHRPVSRRRIYGVKLFVGLSAYLVLTGAAVLAYAAWAAWPGTHASPFEWSMTTPAWTFWLTTSLVYLGAFLSGIRPAAWLGTRLAPLVATTGTALVLAFVTPAWIAWPTTIVCDALLIALILDVAATRDFS